MLDHLFDCRSHPWSNSSKPCYHWHTPSQLPDLLPLRLVSKTFNNHLRKPLYHHVICRRPFRRYRTFKELSWNDLACFVRILHLDVAPVDFPGQSQRVNTAQISTDNKLTHYFGVLRIALKDTLRRYPAIRVLHVTSSYDGILERRIPKNDAMDDCLQALCKSVRGAKLPELEELIVGVPYSGGYTSFFEDLHDKKYTRLLRACGKTLRSASIKLFDNTTSANNYTTMSFF